MRRELEQSNEKVATLSSQLNTNVSSITHYVLKCTELFEKFVNLLPHHVTKARSIRSSRNKGRALLPVIISQKQIVLERF